MSLPSEARFTPLIPILVFLALYTSIGVYLTLIGQEMAFYQFPAPSCALVGFAVALLLGHRNINQHVKTFANGVGEETVVLMCLIFLLSGAFAALTKATGSVHAVVNGVLQLLPGNCIVPSVFIAACTVSIAMGTSMGTITTVAPIAIGISQETALSLPLLLGTVVGGAMFGDNLSVISDTTIAATSTQECSMPDKMKASLKIAVIAAIFTAFALFGFSTQSNYLAAASISYVKILPYCAVLALALYGLNVVAVLLIGITLSAAVGFVFGDITPLAFGKLCYEGFMGMADVFFTSVLVAGLAAIAAKEGGLTWLSNRIKRIGRSKRGGELQIATLVSFADVCVANNVVAVLLTGKMAKEIAHQHHISKGRSASLLDIFSCICQGLIPHGAQLLLISSLAGISPFQIIPYTWYPMALLIVTLFSIYRVRT